MMNSLHVPLSQDILMLVALVSGKMMLVTLQVKKFSLSRPQINQLINQPRL